MSSGVPKASGRVVKADIVFCVDCTSSMQPCIDAVARGLESFVKQLQTAARVGYRLRLIGFRDVHDPGNVPWDIRPFTDSADEFRGWLTQVRAHCNQTHRGAESSLDALFYALRSEWRPEAHHSVVLLTDDNAHPKLHPTTYSLPDNGIERVIQDMQELRHFLLFVVAPKYPPYEQIERAVRFADRKVIAKWVPTSEADPSYAGLAAVDWAPFLDMVGKVVSATSAVMAQSGKKP